MHSQKKGRGWPRGCSLAEAEAVEGVNDSPECPLRRLGCHGGMVVARRALAWIDGMMKEVCGLVGVGGRRGQGRWEEISMGAHGWVI